MSHVIDQDKQLRLPRFKPGDVWNETWQDENHVLLTRLVEPGSPTTPPWLNFEPIPRAELERYYALPNDEPLTAAQIESALPREEPR